MRKIEREYVQMSEQCGLDLLAIKVTKNGHYCLRFVSGTIHAAGSPSDRRNRANILARMRKIPPV